MSSHSAGGQTSLSKRGFSGLLSSSTESKPITYHDNKIANVKYIKKKKQYKNNKRIKKE